MHYNVLALILGGGKGTRLHPLTADRSKPAVPIAAKYRLVDIPISNCLNSKINKIFVLTQFNSASLNKHVVNTYSFDAFSRGFVDILAAEQTSENINWFQGTADAVRQSLPHMLSDNSDYVLILSGDQLYQMDFEKLLNSHKESGAEVTIATLPVNAKDATGFGIMKTNDQNEIISFIEKPTEDELANWSSEVSEKNKEEGKVYLASMGIYLFCKKKLQEMLLRDESQTDFGKHILPDMVNGPEKVNAYQFTGYWSDIGTIESFFEANLNLVDEVPVFNFYDNDNPIYTRARMLPPSKIIGTKLNKVMLADGCLVEGESIERSLIGIRTRIERGSVIRNSYIMGAKRFENFKDIEENRVSNRPNYGVGENCYLDNVIMDINVRLGNNVKIVGHPSLGEQDTDQYKMVDGIVVIKKGAIIPDGTRIGKVD